MNQIQEDTFFGFPNSSYSHAYDLWSDVRTELKKRLKAEDEKILWESKFFIAELKS